VSQKINKKVFAEEGFAELKIRFYTLMGEYFRTQKDAFSLCDCYHEIYNTPVVKADEAQMKAALEATVLFLVLSPYSPEQQDMLHRLSADDATSQIER
jgi:26S proteasome regulatory subunit N5